MLISSTTVLSKQRTSTLRRATRVGYTCSPASVRVIIRRMVANLDVVTESNLRLRWLCAHHHRSHPFRLPWLAVNHDIRGGLCLRARESLQVAQCSLDPFIALCVREM